MIDDALAAALARAETAERERDAAVRAFHDAVCRPMGVVPDSGQSIYSPAEADRAARALPGDPS